MPKIEVYRDAFLNLLNAPAVTDTELEAIFPTAKAELDEPADADGVMKIELNDTNRPRLVVDGGVGAPAAYRARGAPPALFLLFRWGNNAGTR